MALVIASAVVSGMGSMTQCKNIRSCELVSTGIYNLTYADNFNTAPGVAATSWGAGNLIGVNIMAENMCQVQVTDLKGNPVNSGFTFIAIGDQ